MLLGIIIIYMRVAVNDRLFRKFDKKLDFEYFSSKINVIYFAKREV